METLRGTPDAAEMYNCLSGLLNPPVPLAALHGTLPLTSLAVAAGSHGGPPLAARSMGCVC